MGDGTFDTEAYEDEDEHIENEIMVEGNLIEVATTGQVNGIVKERGKGDGSSSGMDTSF